MNLFRQLFGTPARRPAPKSTLQVERLDDRLVPSATVHTSLPGHSAEARGLVTATEESYDYNADGVPDEVYGSATKYTAKGQVAEARYSGDYNGDHVIDYTSVRTFTYDNRNLLVGINTAFQPTGGDPGSTFVSVFTNDSRGNRLSALNTTDYGNNGIDFSSKSASTYDAQSRLLTNTSTRYDAAGTATFIRAMVVGTLWMRPTVRTTPSPAALEPP